MRFIVRFNPFSRVLCITITEENSNGEDSLCVGNQISVETGQESVSEFRILRADEPESIEPLPQPGDYKVVGVTVLDFDDTIFEIDTKEFHFALYDEETGGVVPKVGDKVSFVVHGLSL